MNASSEIRMNIGKPSDNAQWNSICHDLGNLQQSTFYDPVQAYFRQHPVYLEIWKDNILLGGSKIYVYIPGKFTRFTSPFGKYFLQAGESVLKNSSLESFVLPLISDAFEELLRLQRPVWYSSYGYFDKPDYLIKPRILYQSEQSVFANAFVSLDITIDQLWNGIHPHHQHKIEKAQKLGYKVEQSDDIKLFLNLLASTYSNQEHSGPNPVFVKAFYRIMEAEKTVKIFTAAKAGKVISAALVTCYGPLAYYSFGGSERNNDGASHLLHWELIKLFAGQNYSKYYMGQVGVDENSGDQKFNSGISPFKRRFGTSEVLNSRKTFIFKPYSYRVWKMISSLAGKR